MSLFASFGNQNRPSGSCTLTPDGSDAMRATNASMADTVSTTDRTPLAFSPPNFSIRSTTRMSVPAMSESTGTFAVRKSRTGRIFSR